MPPNRDTPAMRQYARFKERHPDCVLFFRMGDFYEMFDDDAVTAHKALGLTLTQRTEGIPMAGIPYHQLDTYLRRIIDAGHRVAVCDQVQDAAEARAAGAVVERAVTRVITPGTLVDDSLLRDDAANTLAAICHIEAGDAPDTRVAAALVELSTGAFAVLEAPAADVIDELARFAPSEIIFPDNAVSEPPPRVQRILDALEAHATPRPAWHFRPAEALEALLEQYAVTTLAGFGIDDDEPLIQPAGAVVRYLRETQAMDAPARPTAEGFSSGTAAAAVTRERSLAHLSPPRKEQTSTSLRIDATGLRALEIERTLRSGAQAGSLLDVFLGDTRVSCATAMGKRLLRQWLVRPARTRETIIARQDCVATLTADERTAAALSKALENVQDVARITARVGLGRATPRDVVALGASLGALDAIADAIDNAPAFDDLRRRLDDLRHDLAPIATRIDETCVERPPASLREGGLVRDGIDPVLDEARALQKDSNVWLAQYQAQLVKTHDLPSLKVGFNKVFGYYIELPRAQASRAPDVFTRKQTLKNAERFITPQLKEYEDKVLRAGETAIQREQEIFLDLCREIADAMGPAARFAETVAQLDVLGCFSRRAALRGWTRPEIADEPVLSIEGGRHPVLEGILGDSFVPNDCALGDSFVPNDCALSAQNRPALALITGPNMAGKSTYIRQVALIVLLAHTGSFVPAERSTVGLTDRIFTRIGADDALHQGQSTFMVEMIETANILHNTSPASLVILDEIGRGTSTLDGLSLAWAITERLAGSAQRPGPRTMFATHYHELTELGESMPDRVANLHVAVREWGEEIVFLHRILEGRTNRSYGIHVARLAGMPRDTVRRADEILETLSVSSGTLDVSGAASEARTRPAPEAAPSQLALFTQYVPHPVIEELKGVDLTRLSPMEAFDALRALQSRLESDT